MRRLVGVLVLVVVAGLLAASPGLSRSGAPVTVGAGVGSGVVLGAAAGHAAATQSVDLLPDVSTAQIARIPVTPGPAVPVVVSGLMMSVQAGTGKHYCYDAFYYNVDAGCASWTGNGGSNGIFTFTAQNSTSRPPDVTGSWVNKAAPSASPPWQLTTSNNGQTLDATWTGGTGHTGLHDTFHGTLTHASGTSAYTGTFKITEAGNTVNGTATFTIDNANQIQIDIQPNSGAASHYTFVRTG